MSVIEIFNTIFTGIIALPIIIKGIKHLRNVIVYRFNLYRTKNRIKRGWRKNLETGKIEKVKKIE